MWSGSAGPGSITAVRPRSFTIFATIRPTHLLHFAWYAVPGNHDHFGIIQSRSHVPETHPLYNRGMYRHYLGPEYYSFNYGGLHFIGLDTVLAIAGHPPSVQVVQSVALSAARSGIR